MSEIFALMENNAPYSLEILFAAKTLAVQLEPKAKVTALYLPENAEFSPQFFSSSIVELIKEKNPEIVLFSASAFGRALAPRISTSFDTGLTADCTSLRIEDNKLISIRPTFGGRLMAEILCKKSPQMATLRPGAIKINAQEDTPGVIVEEIYLSQPDTPFEHKIVNTIKNEQTGSNLACAQIVFTGGKGLKTKENFDKLIQIAAKFPNTAAGATRGAVEAGIAPKHLQIGQTGVSIAPKIYITFGVSGAIHHLIGVENAQKIIAVNIDSTAPIFSNCDYGIRTDAIKFIDEILSLA